MFSSINLDLNEFVFPSNLDIYLKLFDFNKVIKISELSSFNSPFRLLFVGFLKIVNLFFNHFHLRYKFGSLYYYNQLYFIHKKLLIHFVELEFLLGFRFMIFIIFYNIITKKYQYENPFVILVGDFSILFTLYSFIVFCFFLLNFAFQLNFN